MVLVCHVFSQDQVKKSYVTLCVAAHQGELPSCKVWWL